MHSGSLWKLRLMSTFGNLSFHSFTSGSLICSQKLTSKNLKRLHDFNMLQRKKFDKKGLKKIEILQIFSQKC